MDLPFCLSPLVLLILIQRSINHVKLGTLATNIIIGVQGFMVRNYFLQRLITRMFHFVVYTRLPKDRSYTIV